MGNLVTPSSVQKLQTALHAKAKAEAGYRQFAKPPLHPVRFNIREVLPVHARCALGGAALSIGVGQDVFPAKLVVQRVETVPRFSLRFRV